MTTISIKLQSFTIHGVSSITPPALLPSKLNIHRRVSPFSLPSKTKKPNAIPKAFSEELPAKLVEDSKFVPLKADDPTFGPPALLLLGFDLEEASKVKQLLKNMDGEFLQVIYCTEDMIGRSLWDAMNTKQPDLRDVEIAKSVPRICFLSGLTGEEMMMFIDAFPESGLEPAVFAALVPNSADKPLQEVIEEIMGDHEMMDPNTPLAFHPLSIGGPSMRALKNEVSRAMTQRERLSKAFQGFEGNLKHSCRFLMWLKTPESIIF